MISDHLGKLGTGSPHEFPSKQTPVGAILWMEG